MAGAEPITELLEALKKGDTEAVDALFVCVYEELRRLARAVRGGQGNKTMNTTALVHEAYLKLVGSHHLDLQSRQHFLRVAARAMRQVLVTTAHNHMAQKRGGGQVLLPFEEALYPAPVEPAQVVALDEALQQLEMIDPRQVQVVECRFFAGLTIPETAEIMDLSIATVNREWRMARAWLVGALKSDG